MALLLILILSFIFHKIHRSYCALKRSYAFIASNIGQCVCIFYAKYKLISRRVHTPPAATVEATAWSLHTRYCLIGWCRRRRAAPHYWCYSTRLELKLKRCLARAPRLVNVLHTLHREAPRREFFPPVWADVCSVPTPARRSARKFHKHRRVDPLPLLRRRRRRRVVSYPAEFVFWLSQVCGVQNSCFCYYVTWSCIVKKTRSERWFAKTSETRFGSHTRSNNSNNNKREGVNTKQCSNVLPPTAFNHMPHDKSAERQPLQPSRAVIS